jgi:DNA-binding transcriptional regulator YhcF (GntR family)
VRQLAADLELAPNTVARAYRELEQDGLIVTRGHRGTFVAPPRSSPSEPAPDPTVAAQLVAAAQAFAAHARGLGIDRRDAVLAVNEALRMASGKNG